jgi:hypothetical protein
MRTPIAPERPKNIMPGLAPMGPDFPHFRDFCDALSTSLPGLSRQSLTPRGSFQKAAAIAGTSPAMTA